MKKFMLFVGGLIALIILLVNLGPLVLLGISVFLLYVIFKKFIKSTSTTGKLGWIIAGLFVLSIALSNSFAVIGIAAAFGLYWIYKSWKKDEDLVVEGIREDDDPFQNFERQWAEINN